MKGLLVLLCVFAAAQARSTGIHQTQALAVLGENPWIVHLRLAVLTGGHLETCAGSVIGHKWVLTAFSCIRFHRFIWLRYGLVEVMRPSLVLETNLVRVHPNLDLALIDTSRHVKFNKNIGAVTIPTTGAKVPAIAKFCGFGATESGAAGNRLACFNVNVEDKQDGTLLGQSDEGETTSFDVGAPLVVDGVQYGVLVRSGEQSVFINPAIARDWIRTTTGIDLGPDDEDEEGEEDGDNGDEDDDNEEEDDDNEEEDDDNEEEDDDNEEEDDDNEEEDSDTEEEDGDTEEESESESQSSESSSSSEESDERRAVQFVN